MITDMDIKKLMDKGMYNAQIAEHLGITRQAVGQRIPRIEAHIKAGWPLDQIVDQETYCEVLLCNKAGQVKATSLIDKEDREIVGRYKWCLSGAGYASRSKGNGENSTKLHRFLMRPPKGMVVDHINRDRLDNRKANLRIVTPQENAANSGPGLYMLLELNDVLADKNTQDSLFQLIQLIRALNNKEVTIQTIFDALEKLE
jgi:hypothetical protein